MLGVIRNFPSTFPRLIFLGFGQFHQDQLEVSRFYGDSTVLWAFFPVIHSLLSSFIELVFALLRIRAPLSKTFPYSTSPDLD